MVRGAQLSQQRWALGLYRLTADFCLHETSTETVISVSRPDLGFVAAEESGALVMIGDLSAHSRTRSHLEDCKS